MTNKQHPPFESPTCPNDDNLCECVPKDYVIKEEEEALAVLRDLKKQVHTEKARMTDIQQALKSDSENVELCGELKVCENNLKELRVQWDKWDQKRKAATREKLIRLGHISPNDPYE